MKKYLVLYAVAVTALFVCSHRRYRAENRRSSRTRPLSPPRSRTTARRPAGGRLGAGPAAAVRGVRSPRARPDVEEIRRLGLKIRRLEAAAKTVTATEAEIRTPLRDTVVVRSGDPHPVRDSVRLFRWRDPWVTVEGRIGRDSAVCRIRSIDTLRQVVHRIPRRFLFIRWGTKALRQEIVSTNPHTRIVHAEYVKIER